MSWPKQEAALVTIRYAGQPSMQRDARQLQVAFGRCELSILFTAVFARRRADGERLQLRHGKTGRLPNAFALKRDSISGDFPKLPAVPPACGKSWFDGGRRRGGCSGKQCRLQLIFGEPRVPIALLDAELASRRIERTDFG